MTPENYEREIHSHPQHNPDNPVFRRQQPEPFVPEIPQGLHGAPALRSELETPPLDPSPVGPSDYFAQDTEPAQAPQPAQDSAIEAADQSAHNAAVAAEVADKAADDAAANAEAVHNE